MTVINTQNLIGPALDWAVAKCEGVETSEFLALMNDHSDGGMWQYHFSTDWAQGGPIIERERIGLDQFPNSQCRAYVGTPVKYEHAMWAPESKPLIAAMCCYVASKLGEEVEVPQELVN